MDPYGLRRVVAPAGVLPQRADRLDPTLPLGEDELLVDVEALNVDAASFRQIEAAAGHDPAAIGAAIARIVAERGKLHNPVTGSGGVLLGRVAEVGPRHPAAGALKRGDRITTLVSLTLTPLVLDRVVAVHPDRDRVDVEGRAILFATGLWARLPDDLPEALVLAALDVCGAPALVRRHLAPGARVLVLGAGKAGALVAVSAREALEGRGWVVAADRSRAALDDLRRIGAVDDAVEVDATDAVGTLERLGRAGPPFDLVVNCCSVPGTELASALAARDGGAVIYFSMATSFTAAALGVEGVGKDVTLLMGNGYVPGHAELTLDLLRRLPRLRGLFERRYVR